MNKAISILMLTVCMFVIAANSQPEVHPGIKLYQEGKNVEAVRSLEIAVKTKEFEKNAEVWNFLGLSYIKNADLKKARKALEKAVKLAPANSIMHSNLAYVYLISRQIPKARSTAKKAIELDPKNVTAYYLRGSANMSENKIDDAERDADQVMIIDAAYPQGYILKSNILLARLGRKVTAGSTPRAEIKYLEDAVEVLKRGIENSKNNTNNQLSSELESAEVFYKYFTKEKPEPGVKPEPDPSITPMKITSRPKPSYTDAARQASVRGTIQMAVLFGASGKVQQVLLLNRLGYGLDENALKVAYNIGFEPQKKDGKPVSIVRMIEMSFDIY